MIKVESFFLCCVARRETSQWNCLHYERHYNSQQFVDYLKPAWHSFRQTGDNAIDRFSPYWKWCQWGSSVGHAKLVCNTHTHNLDDSRVVPYCDILWWTKWKIAMKYFIWGYSDGNHQQSCCLPCDTVLSGINAPRVRVPYDGGSRTLWKVGTPLRDFKSVHPPVYVYKWRLFNTQSNTVIIFYYY
jgi:hypothetical protein